MVEYSDALLLDVIFLMRIFIKKLVAAVLSIAVTALLPFSVVAADISEADARRDIINSFEGLDVKAPQSQELSSYIDELLSEIITEDMDRFEQVKACFDYVRANTTYGTHYTQANMNTRIGDTTIGSIYSRYGEVEGFGAVALVNGVGMCNAYASAFIMFARKLGFDAYLVKGSTKGSGGGYRYHEWCEINIDGVIYVFDPQLDQSFSRSGLGDYKIFCVTYDQIPGRFLK